MGTALSAKSVTARRRHGTPKDVFANRAQQRVHRRLRLELLTSLLLMHLSFEVGAPQQGAAAHSSHSHQLAQGGRIDVFDQACCDVPQTF